MYLLVIDFIASYETNPPKNASKGGKFPLQESENYRSTVKMLGFSLISFGSNVCSNFGYANLINSYASSKFQACGILLCNSLKASKAEKATCRILGLLYLTKSALRSSSSSGGFFSFLISFIVLKSKTFGIFKFFAMPFLSYSVKSLVSSI